MFSEADSCSIISGLDGLISGRPAWIFLRFMLSLYSERTQVLKGDVVALKKEHCYCCAWSIHKCEWEEKKRRD